MAKIRYKNTHVQFADNVYEPAEDTFLLTDSAFNFIRNGMNVLEIGTGSGFVSAVLKTNFNINIITTEINPHAARCARSNGVEVVRTDMFDGLKPYPCFDFILFNPPYLPTNDDEKVPGWMNYSYDGGVDGCDAIRDFLNNVCDYLKPEGIIMLLVSSLSGTEYIEQMMESRGFEVNIVCRNRYFFEELVVLCGRHKN
ncbi:MAG: HemK2/MTQ2 family protein methyltransferase [Methanohalobium sp.]|uniref:HemK2/MTQ2 family protein methyltransferase n=1 Tax=Methanohalobium sp. TaxID=2837493 RepID=UPI00397B3D8E